jgi:hypothetical protein
VNRSLIAILCLCACAKGPVASVEFGGVTAVEREVGASVMAIDASTPLLEAGERVVESGLVVPVPAGWYGQRGSEASARRLTLHHRETRLIVEFWRYPRTAEAEPRPHGGCDWAFVDGGAYATLPILGAASVATCLPERASDPTVQAWFVFVGPYQWHIEARFKPGSLISARPALEAMLGLIGLDED